MAIAVINCGEICGKLILGALNEHTKHDDDNMLFKRHAFSYPHNYLGKYDGVNMMVEDVIKTMTNTPELKLIWGDHDTKYGDTHRIIKYKFNDRVLLVNSNDLIVNSENALKDIYNFLNY